MKDVTKQSWFGPWSDTAPGRYLRRYRSYWTPVAILLVCAGLIILPLPFRDNRYFLSLFILCGMFVALSMSYNLLWGFLGMLSFAHAGFLGIGAYTAAILSSRYDVGFLTDILAAIAVTAVISFIIGIPALRLTKTSFVMVTLALFLVLLVVSTNWVQLTNGALGITAIVPARIRLPGGSTFTFDNRLKTYYLFLGYAILVVLSVLRIVRSRVGRVFVAIREDELLAQAMGINVFKYKLIGFVIGSALAGGLGSLYAHWVTFVGPTIFDHYWNVRMLLMVIVGGRGSILGVLISSVFFTLLPEYLREAQQYREVVFGLVFTIAVILLPNGLVVGFKRLLRRFQRSPDADAA